MPQVDLATFDDLQAFTREVLLSKLKQVALQVGLPRPGPFSPEDNLATVGCDLTLRNGLSRWVRKNCVLFYVKTLENPVVRHLTDALFCAGGRYAHESICILLLERFKCTAEITQGTTRKDVLLVMLKSNFAYKQQQFDFRLNDAFQWIEMAYSMKSNKFCEFGSSFMTLASNQKKASPQRGLTPKSPPKIDSRLKAIIVKDGLKWKNNSGVRFTRERLSATLPDGIIRIICKYVGVNVIEPTGYNANLPGTEIAHKLYTEVVGVVHQVGQKDSRIVAGQFVLAYVPVEIFAIENVMDVSQEYLYVLPSLNPKYLLATSCGIQALLCSRRVTLNENSRVLVDSHHYASSTIFGQLVRPTGCNLISVVDHLSAVVGPRVTEYLYNDNLWNELLHVFQEAKLDASYSPLRCNRDLELIFQLLQFDRGIFTGGGSSKYIQKRMTSGYPSMESSCEVKIYDINERLASVRGNFREEVQQLVDYISAGQVTGGLCTTDYHGLRSVPQAVLASIHTETEGKVYIRL